MNDADARLVAAHIVKAITAHESACRRNAIEVPPALVSMRELLESLARTRQDATQVVTVDEAAHGVPMTPVLLRKREAATSLRCSVRTVERLIANGDLVAVGMGGQVRIRPSDLDAYVATMQRRSFRTSIESKEA